jgi:hypothetical protein
MLSINLTKVPQLGEYWQTLLDTTDGSMSAWEPTAEMGKEYEAHRFRNEGNQQPS